MTTMLADTPAPSSGFPWLGVLLGVGIVGGGIALLSAISRRPGWYVLNFTDPVGNPNRRLKGYRGPFTTREEAVACAQKQRWIDTPSGRYPLWVPKVEYREQPPR